MRACPDEACAEPAEIEVEINVIAGSTEISTDFKPLGVSVLRTESATCYTVRCLPEFLGSVILEKVHKKIENHNAISVKVSARVS